MQTRLKKGIAKSLVCIVLLGFVPGCGRSSADPPKLGVKNWKPTGIGGPVTVRPIPSAADMENYHEQWLRSDSATRARVYSLVMRGASNQVNFKVSVSRDETPLGKQDFTEVSFFYRDLTTTNGFYQLMWNRHGRHSGDFLKIGDEPKTVWVTLNPGYNKNGIPLMKIVGFEGLEAGVVMAEPGKATNQ